MEENRKQGEEGGSNIEELTGGRKKVVKGRKWRSEIRQEGRVTEDTEQEEEEGEKQYEKKWKRDEGRRGG